MRKMLLKAISFVVSVVLAACFAGCTPKQSEGGVYFANSKTYLKKGWGDEGFYKELLGIYAK